MILPKLKILVALDDSKNSQRGLYITKQNDTKLTGIHVMCNNPKEFQKIKYSEKILIETDKIMYCAKQCSIQNGILFDKKITFGDINSEIIQFAKTLNYDTIIIGAKIRDAVREIFFESISNYILHRTNISIKSGQNGK